VSDSPFTLDKDRWRAALSSYRIDGRPVFDLANPLQRARMEEVLDMADDVDGLIAWVESKASLQRRLLHPRLITDDNMGTEWRVPESGAGG